MEHLHSIDEKYTKSGVVCQRIGREEREGKKGEYNRSGRKGKRGD
jgi:hypothetical protein